MLPLLLLLLLLHLVTVIWGMIGVDLTLEYKKQHWLDLMKQQTVDFVITRLQDERGVIDSKGISTLAEAFQAGIKDLSGYIYPCISSSTFGTSNKLVCKSPEEQISSLLFAMNSTGLLFSNLPIKSFYPTGQPTRQPSTQPTSQPSLPTGQPSRDPTRQPFGHPSSQPTGSPSAQTPHVSVPTHVPTPYPTKTPSGSPTGQPTGSPTRQPRPTRLPSPNPTRSPTYLKNSPTPIPSPVPTGPSALPTRLPTLMPTVQPTALPTAPSPFPSAAPTVRPTYINGTRGSSLRLKRIFLMVEDDSPNRYFSVDNKINQRYLVDLAYACWLRGIQLGIYTTIFYWNNIMTLPFDKDNADADRFLSGLSRDHLPLWVPRFDKTPGDMSFFVPFGGWDHVYMKQFTGGSAEARRAGSWRINLNYANASDHETGVWQAQVDPVAPYDH